MAFLAAGLSGAPFDARPPSAAAKPGAESAVSRPVQRRNLGMLGCDWSMNWVGPAGSTQDAGSGTDFYAIENNYVSVTPLQVDLTQHDRVQVIRDWLEK